MGKILFNGKEYGGGAGDISEQEVEFESNDELNPFEISDVPLVKSGKLSAILSRCLARPTSRRLGMVLSLGR